MANSNIPKQIVTKCSKHLVSKKSPETIAKTIGMFDLVGSTSMKLKQGHEKAMKIVRFHNCICKNIIEMSHGNVIKEVGDGLLAVFDNPFDACQASIKIRDSIKIKKHATKISLAYGMVEPIKLASHIDYVGSTVDLCAKIEKFAQPNQILIDEELFGLIKTFSTSENILISESMSAIVAKNEIKLFELTSKKGRLIKRLNLPLTIEPRGQLSIKEHLRFIQQAKKDVIEIGTDLHDFINYLTEYTLKEFKNPLKQLLDKGVLLTFLLVDPNWTHLQANDKKELSKQIQKNLNSLKNFKKECKNLKLKGKITIRVYQKNPQINIIGVDLNYKNGQINIVHNLLGITNMSKPLLQLSKEENLELYETYHTSITEILKGSKIRK